MFCHQVDANVRLKLLLPSDAEAIFALVDASRGHLRRWLPWVDATASPGDITAFIQAGLDQLAANKGFHAGIWYRGEPAGVVGFHPIDLAHRIVSLGYWLGEGFEGRGIMSAACRGMVDIAFGEYGLHKVEIQAAAENARSRAVAERLGFQNEGLRRQCEWLYDHFVDHVLYGMLAEDWPEATRPGV